MTSVHLLIIVCVVLDVVVADVRLIKPASRRTMIPKGEPVTPNNCGGFEAQWANSTFCCGICGDPCTGPRHSEAPGKYVTDTIAATYEQGSVIDVTVTQDKPYVMGYFEFRVCAHSSLATPATQACLDEHVLLVDEPGVHTRFYPGSTAGTFNVRLRLPTSLTCTRCVLQMKHVAGNRFPEPENPCKCLGCGKQEHSFSCADVKIKKATTTTPPPSNDKPPTEGAGPPLVTTPSPGTGNQGNDIPAPALNPDDNANNANTGNTTTGSNSGNSTAGSSSASPTNTSSNAGNNDTGSLAAIPDMGDNSGASSAGTSNTGNSTATTNTGSSSGRGNSTGSGKPSVSGNTGDNSNSSTVTGSNSGNNTITGSNSVGNNTITGSNSVGNNTITGSNSGGNNTITGSNSVGNNTVTGSNSVGNNTISNTVGYNNAASSRRKLPTPSSCTPKSKDYKCSSRVSYISNHWCLQNCLLGNCNPKMCYCYCVDDSAADATTPAPPPLPKTCKSADDPKYDTWCATNYANQWCPTVFCKLIDNSDNAIGN